MELAKTKIKPNIFKRFYMFILRILKDIILLPWNILKTTLLYIRALLLLLNYVTYHFWKIVWGLPIFPKVYRDWVLPLIKYVNHTIKKFLDMNSKMSLSPSKALDITMNNLIKKKSRTLLTTGGVGIGIGAIVFLVSIGYGLQSLVVEKISSLDEVTQLTVTSRNANINKINEKLYSDIKNYSETVDVQPLISVVGSISYNNSISSLAVYGVTTTYLTDSVIKPVSGKYFESNEIIATAPEPTNVKGISDSQIESKKIYEFNFPSTKWIPVYEKADRTSKIIGYTKTSPTSLLGEYVENKSLKFLSSFYYLWEKTTCKKNDTDCNNGYKVMRDQYKAQVQKSGYVEYPNAKVIKIMNSNVLGVTNETLDETNILGSEVEAATDFVELLDELKTNNEVKTELLTISPSAIKKAVVNTEFVKLIGLTNDKAVGKSVKITFSIPPELLNKSNIKITTNEVEYEILGVVDSEKSPIIYIPYIDLKTIGIINESSFRVKVNSEKAVTEIRHRIESLGYNTSSVLDTVTQVNNLFSSITFLLGVMGFVALAVASLGMFNTFTISLLERTREIGLMKAMGMKSNEVRDLFMTESLVMGLGGGLLGLLIGLILSAVTNFVVSTYALSKGVEVSRVSSAPAEFIITILGLSLFVGLVTGLYPAARSKKISALDALRYE
jgi:ABC-type antimicrobial peptide transport system permease subunit